jgi:SAM-dependent methyltransferase
VSGPFDSVGVDLRGQAVVVLTPDSERVAAELVSDHGAAAADVLSVPIASRPEIVERSYDVALVGDLLYQLPPTVVEDALRWIYDHLQPGGRCLVQTRTYLSTDGGGLADRVRTPYAHLAFARDVVREYYDTKGWPAPTGVNCMCRATYLVLFRRVGFVIDEVALEQQEPDRFADKLQFYDPAELRASRLTATLRRPHDDAQALAELRATLRRT